MEFLHQLFPELPVAEKMAVIQTMISAGALVLSVVGLWWIGWGLFQMGRASKVRNKEIDVMGEALGKIGQALDRQGQAMTQALTQQGQALTQQGQALERQGQALDRQGGVMTEAVQGLRQQGEVLAELLRRTA